MSMIELAENEYIHLLYLWNYRELQILINLLQDGKSNIKWQFTFIKF